MSKQTINIGASPNDGTGTPLRTSFDYTNQNFTELYTALGGGVGLPGATTQVIFNDGGTNLAGDAGLVYNKTTDTLTAGNATITGAATVATNVLVANVAGYTGKVGIGTATPGETLDVKGTGNFNNTSGTYLGFQTNAAQVGYIGTANTIITGGLNTELGLWANSSLVIATGASALQRLRVEAAGDVTVSTGNVVMATSGKGIDFSATASGSGTMTSELLNDYEEGTFTATLTGTVANPTIPVTATGRYTKIGRVVSVSVFFSSVITTGASGRIQITGLPFTNNSSITSVGTAAFNGMATFTGSPFASLATSDTTIIMFSSNSAASYAAVNFNAGITQDLWVSLNYTVA